MSPDPLLSILEGALEREGAEREQFVESSCAGDAELLAKVRKLLAEEAKGDDWNLTRSRSLLSPLFSSAHFPLLGTRLGPWKLVRVLGEGGMGTVYQGERADEAYAQTVAIKVIRSDVQQSAMLERFDQERQIHAALDHPAIATLLDAGRSDSGSPYFVMEYVQGQRIDEYCDNQDLDAAERIRLFLKLAKVVHDTHALGIVHRDLKPSNVMVEPGGQIKLLDFGVALVLGGGDGAVTLPFVTPAYSAPENMRGEEVTRAGDQYSLAVILQELLTERRPNTGPAGKDAGPARLRRGTLVGYSDRSRFLLDLEAILRRALADEPRDRYASVAEFASDLENLLDGVPVAARPSTRMQRTWRSLRPHLWTVAGLLLVLGTLLASIAYTQIKGRQYRRALADAQQARQHSEANTRELERFAKEILQGLEGRLRGAPDAHTLRERLLAIGTDFFGESGDPGSVPAGLLMTVLDSYHFLALLRLNPMDGGPTRIREARDAYGKAMALLPHLEASEPARGREMHALLNLDLGAMETDQLQLSHGYALLQEALKLLAGGPQDHRPAQFQRLRAYVAMAENRMLAEDGPAARDALKKFGTEYKELGKPRDISDAFLMGSSHINLLHATMVWHRLGDREEARRWYQLVAEQPWSHPGQGNPSVSNTVGRLQRLRLDWLYGDEALRASVLDQVQQVLGVLERAPVEQTRYPEGAARLFALRARILADQGEHADSQAAYADAFRMWRFCIRQDPDNAAVKYEMTMGLLECAEDRKNWDADPIELQAIWEEARAHLEGLRRLEVDAPFVERQILRLEARRRQVLEVKPNGR
ncbi:MAG: serine/threonine-protein kinase [Planctomycetota bacterium]